MFYTIFKGGYQMNREDRILQLIKEKFKSVREFSSVSGIPNSTIVSMLKNGLGGTSVDTVLLVCKLLGISIEDLNSTKNKPHAEAQSCPLYEKIGKLDVEDTGKAEAYIDGLLSSPKYEIASGKKA